MTAPQVVADVPDLRQAVRQARRKGLTVGFVPTMGALHEGHAQLIRACAAETGFAVVSIFVNPTQFGPNEDFQRYPRTPEPDHALCDGAGASLIFEPSVSTMYPSGGLSTVVDVPAISGLLEGASRPGHFQGVATVVLKLLNQVQPDFAFFGEKDYQQLQVIRTMVRDLDLNVAIRGVPTVREPSGLAMSSRNRYLSDEERQAAAVLSQALAEADDAVRAGERSADRVRQILRSRIESERLARVDYAEIADSATLQPLDQIKPGAAVALLAVRVGPARLIDNRLLPS